MDDLSTLPLRALIALARERLGAGAAALKTRAEFAAALSGQPVGAPGPPPAPSPPEAAASPPPPALAVVTRDFFVARRS